MKIKIKYNSQLAVMICEHELIQFCLFYFYFRATHLHNDAQPTRPGKPASEKSKQMTWAEYNQEIDKSTSSRGGCVVGIVLYNILKLSQNN